MEKFKLGFYLAALAAIFTATASAQKTKCTDDPLIFTLFPSYTDPSSGTGYSSGIVPDGLGPYVNGQNGVSAVLKTCEGTGDAILSPGSSRSVSLDLRHAVYTSSQTPSWANSVLPVGGVNIWKLLYNYAGSAGVPYSFTTGMGVPGVDNPNYYYRMENPSRAPSSSTDSADANTPCATALVNVMHNPSTSTSKENWIVWADSMPTTCNSGATASQVGTLFHYTKSFLNVGQFTTPFYIVIQRP